MVGSAKGEGLRARDMISEMGEKESGRGSRKKETRVRDDG